ncbi:hypothetical protein ACAG25_17430 [Mycobacterium sp. pV006]|uniref:hypothetical protein n=1 Tax=Mycobacterium sp. pV006 TaxID=3238983 RepID=UPI00351ACBB0
MKSKRIGIIVCIAAVVLLVGTLVAGLWPVKSDYKTSCGSFLAASDSVYNDAYQRNMGMMGDAAYDVGAYSENSLGLPSGAFDVVARNMANEEVTKCAGKRQVTGIIAGVLLVLTLGAGATGAYLLLRQRGGPAAV